MGDGPAGEHACTRGPYEYDMMFCRYFPLFGACLLAQAEDENPDTIPGYRCDTVLYCGLLYELSSLPSFLLTDGRPITLS